jgi:hypothetical protein
MADRVRTNAGVENDLVSDRIESRAMTVTVMDNRIARVEFVKYSFRWISQKSLMEPALFQTMDTWSSAKIGFDRWLTHWWM